MCIFYKTVKFSAIFLPPFQPSEILSNGKLSPVFYFLFFSFSRRGYQSGGEVTFRFHAARKDEKKIKTAFSKWKDHGHIGNISLAQEDISFTTDPLISLQVRKSFIHHMRQIRVCVCVFGCMCVCLCMILSFISAHPVFQSDF